MEWKKSRIGDCIQCNPTVKLEKGKEYPIIDIDKITVGRKYVTNKDTLIYSGQSGCKFQKGDTLMARITPCLENGKMAQAKVEDKGIGSTELFVFRGLNNITDNDYVYYFIKQQYIRNLAANSMSGASGRQRADMKFIKKIQFDLPPLSIQQKIASILSTYDTLIENNTKRIRMLEKMAENLYKEWFVRFRFPGHENVGMENGLPKGWKNYSLRDLCDINKNTISSKRKDELIHYLDTSAITNNNIAGYEDYILKDAPSRAKRVVKHNSIIFSTVRPNLRHLGILKNPVENTIVSTGFAVFDCKYDIANIVYRFLSSSEIVNYCQSIAEGAVATYPSIKPEEIARIKVTLPSIEKAVYMNRQFEKLISEQNLLTKQNSLLTRQRDLLLPRLMSGKLEVMVQ